MCTCQSAGYSGVPGALKTAGRLRRPSIFPLPDHLTSTGAWSKWRDLLLGYLLHHAVEVTMLASHMVTKAKLVS
jgi:hypothetical protein